MVSQVLQLLTNAVVACANWFTGILNVTQGASVYLGVIVITLSVRYILRPLVGRPYGSDIARSSGSKGDDNSSTDLMVI